MHLAHNLPHAWPWRANHCMPMVGLAPQSARLAQLLSEIFPLDGGQWLAEVAIGHMQLPTMQPCASADMCAYLCSCMCMSNPCCLPTALLRMHATSVHVCTYVCPFFPLARLRSYAAPSVHVRKLCHPRSMHTPPALQGSGASTRAGSKIVSRSERCHQCLQRSSRSTCMLFIHKLKLGWAQMRCLPPSRAEEAAH